MKIGRRLVTSASSSSISMTNSPLSSHLILSQVLQVNLSTVFTLSRDFGRHMLSTRGGITGEDAPQYPEGEGREVEEGSKGKEWGGRGNGKIVNVASLISYQGMFLVVFRVPRP